MPELSEDAASRLWWGVRKYVWVFLVTVPLAAVALLAASPGNITREYQTSSLVIAKDRGDIATDSIARLYESVFGAGTVAQRAVTLGNLPINPRDLIPDHASLEPVESNIVAHVIGSHPQLDLAKRIADSTAIALVEELNRVFDGVAEFERLGDAPLPESAVTSVSRVAPLILGIAVGLLAGLGAIGLLLTIRRPILSAEEASALVGSPLVGTPTLPARRGLPPEPSQVPGLAALVKRVFPKSIGTAVFISHIKGEELRTVLAQMVAATLGRDQATFLVSSPDEQVRWLYEHLTTGPKVTVTDSLPDSSAWSRFPIVIDGPSAKGSDTPQLIPESAQIVLVVVQGIRRTRLLEVSSQFLPGEITGVLFARRGTSWPWLAGPQRPPVGEAATPVIQPQQPAVSRRSEQGIPSSVAQRPEQAQRASAGERPVAGQRIDERPAAGTRSEPSPRPSSPETRPGAESPGLQQPAPPTQRPASPLSTSSVQQDRSDTRPGGSTIEAPKPAGSKPSTQVEGSGWTPASELEREERRLQSMMPPRAQPEQPLLWQPPREPRAPRQINLDDLAAVPTDVSNGKDVTDEAPSAPRDGGSVSRRDAE
jgi:hypothetical protein